MLKILKNHKYNLFIRWIIYSFFGLIFGLILGVLISIPIESNFGVWGMAVLTPVIFGVAGAVLGGSHWLSLSWKSRFGLRWIIASAVGFSVGATLSLVLIEKVGTYLMGIRPTATNLSLSMQILSFFIIGGFSGLSLGFSQWIILREFKQTETNWILVSFIAFGVGMPLASILANLIFGGMANIQGTILWLIITSLFIGVVTGNKAKYLSQISAS